MNRPNFDLHARDCVIKLGQQTKVMGIVNCSPDSFSGDGKQGPALAVAYARKLASQGADIIDIGGESTRPGAAGVTAEEEIKRVIPVIKALASTLPVPISVDTSKVEVARRALDAGASIVNIVRGTQINKVFLKLIKDYQAAMVLMHMRGTPATMQSKANYINLIEEIVDELKISVENCLANGIKKDRIVIDPGLGFAKTFEHNLILINCLGRFNILKCPILIGPSRKSFIGRLLNDESGDRMLGTAAAVTIGAARGAHMVRVHDVAAVKETLRVTDAILQAH